MCLFRTSPYAEWRRLSGAALCLNENSRDQPPPERLLQAIWFHQRLLRERLRTVDGRPLRVLHPGFLNREHGPDFRHAVLQWEGESPCSGDIEIDLQGHDWHAHRHDANPEFRNVLLHVVWEGPAPHDRPTLLLRPVLDSSLSDLGTWLGTEAATLFPVALRGQCCRPLQTLNGEMLRQLLHEAAYVRLQAKAAHFVARARQVGWDQTLWEGLFRALGYKQNGWPMQHLAEGLPQINPVPGKLNVLELQARLLGVAGLLPKDVMSQRQTRDRYLRRLWDCWWRERESFEQMSLPPMLWRLAGQRPANHPQRRLALAAHWLADRSFLTRIRSWCERSLPGRAAPSALFEVLRVPEDDFWSWHWTFRSSRLNKARPLLGMTRATDLAVNVILPWLWMRASEGGNDRLRGELERRYFAWPSAEDNALLRLAQRRLLGTQAKASVRGAAAQQGLTQIVRDFCEHANSLCAECPFPELVNRWSGPGAPAPVAH